MVIRRAPDRRPLREGDEGFRRRNITNSSDGRRQPQQACCSMLRETFANPVVQEIIGAEKPSLPGTATAPSSGDRSGSILLVSKPQRNRTG